MASDDLGMGLRRRSLSPSPSTSSHRPPRSPGLNLWDTDNIENPLPSPPYKRNASNPTIFLGAFAENSPAYQSLSNLDIPNELTPMTENSHEKHERYEEGDERGSDEHDHPRPSAKVTRFEEGVMSPLEPVMPPFARTDTTGTDPTSISPSIADTDDEDEYYDWSGEEDLVDEAARFERNMGVASQEQWGFRKYVALIFGSLVGSTLMAGLLVTPALLVHFYWFKPHPTEHRRYVKDNLEAWFFWAAANLVISWYLALVIDVFPILTRFLISAFWGHVSESVKTRIELYNGVKDTLKPLFYAANAWVSWIIVFGNIYELRDMDNPSNSRAQYTIRLYQVVEFMFFFALVVCCEQMVQHAIAFSFHRTAYRDRLENLQKALWAIERLRTYRPKRSHIKSASQGFGSRSLNALNLASFGYGSRPGTPTHSRGPSRASTPAHSRPSSPARIASANEAAHHIRDHRDLEGPTLTRQRSKRKGKIRGRVGCLNRDNSPVTESASSTPPHRRATDSPSYRYPPGGTPPRGTGMDDGTAALGAAATTVARTLKTAVLHDARNLEGRDNSDLSGLVWDVSSSYEAKRLARSIWTAFRSPSRYWLVPTDFRPAFASQEEADKAFSVFDNDGNGDLSRSEIKTTLIMIYRERRSLSRSMRDVSQALRSFNQILLFFAMVILLFISLSVFEVNIGSSLTSLYSLGIGLSFIFKNSASNAFDAITFLFVTHPFDTGDRVFIDDENFVVKKMGLFATVFQRFDGTESYYFNSQLFNKFIINARRSDKTAEGLTLQLDWRTPLEKLDKLADCLNQWLKIEPNRWFQPDTSVTPQNIKYMRHLEITIGIGHNSNWQDWNLRLARRTAFNAAVNYYCRLLGITAYQSPMPIWYTDPSVSDTYVGDEEYDADHDAEVASMVEQPEPPRNSTLGFQPPPDKPIRGLRPRKSRGQKAMLRTMGADG